jgi:hypothetical protein
VHALCRNLLSQSSIEIIVLKSNVKLFFRTWIELIDKLSSFKKRTSTNKSVQVFFWTPAGYHCFSICFEAPTTILFSEFNLCHSYPAFFCQWPVHTNWSMRCFRSYLCQYARIIKKTENKC